MQAGAYDEMLDEPISDLPDGSPQWRENAYLQSIKGGPAGGVYSTVGDLARLADALMMSGRLVGGDMRRQMFTKIMVTEVGQSWHGLGFFIDDLPEGQRLIEHAGAFPGSECRWGIVLDRDGDGYAVLAVLSNRSDAASRVYDQALRLLPRW